MTPPTSGPILMSGAMVRAKELERLREAAHEAPLNKIFTDHKGNRSLGTHSMAWARASREYGEALRASYPVNIDQFETRKDAQR